MHTRFVSSSSALGIWLVLLAGVPHAAEHTIRAVQTDLSPKLDGFIEPVWATADSVTDFAQSEPKQGEPATEQTVAYVLHDHQNLYVAFQCCDAEPGKLVADVRPRGDPSGDRVRFYLDTFDDDVTAYEFCVNAAGVQDDSYVSGDGVNSDKSWDGVWYSAARATGLGYVVEVRIPLKSLRHKKGLTRWGIGFQRWICRKEETASWPPQSAEAFRVSKLGQLVGIRPGETGHHLELYPVALARYDRPEMLPDAGLDLSWYPTAASSFQLTANPDFAQVEADPYQINLSRYEAYFGERRPFFVEGSDVFDCMGGVPKLFYSRRVGKRLSGGEQAPILAGSKLIARPGRFRIGALAALTDEVEYPDDDTTRVEPRRWYSALRVRRRFLNNSELGVIYAGREGDGHGRASALDGELRMGDLALNFIAAYTDNSDADAGYGLKIGPYYRSSDFLFRFVFEYTDEHFDVSPVGFYPWTGLKALVFYGGPIMHNKGPFKRIMLKYTGKYVKEVAEPHWQRSIAGDFDFNLASNWGFYLGPNAGKTYEEGRWYGYWSMGFSLWSDWSRPIAASCGLRYNSQEYNYRRAYFAANANGDLDVSWRVNPRLRLGVTVSNSTELKPDGSTEKISWVSHPTLDCAIRSDLHLRLWSEPNTDTHIHRLNLLFSWNFLPKSWVYLAFNESRDNAGGDWKLQDRIVVAKVRYLFLL